MYHLYCYCVMYIKTVVNLSLSIMTLYLNLRAAFWKALRCIELSCWNGHGFKAYRATITFWRCNVYPDVCLFIVGHILGTIIDKWWGDKTVIPRIHSVFFLLLCHMDYIESREFWISSLFFFFTKTRFSYILNLKIPSIWDMFSCVFQSPL